MVAILQGPQLPWSPFTEEDRRFRRISAWIVALSAAFSAVVPSVSIPTLEEEEQKELPPRLVRVLLGDAASAVPAVSPPRADKSTVAESTDFNTESTAERPSTAESRQPSASTPTPEAREPIPGSPQTTPPRQPTRDAGVLNMRETLAALQNRPSSLSTLSTRKGSALAPPEPKAPARPAASPDDADNTHGSSASGLDDPLPLPVLRLQARGTATPAVSDNAPAPAPSVRRSAGRRQASRTEEEIQAILDRNKASIYALYNRELETDPTLKGRVVLSLTIGPSGKVTACQIKDSELTAPSFERALVRHIRSINFGPEPDAPSITTTVPIEFLPT